MRTKEEILDAENAKPDEMLTDWVTVSRMRALAAMDEYAKEVGVNLLKRIRENNWQHYGKPNSTNPINIWYSENNYGLSDEQLYDKITKQPTQNNITL
jgi:hypothetical protein